MAVDGDMAQDRCECERLRAQVRTLEQRIADLDSLAHEDPLLHIPNRRGLMRELARMISRAARYEESCALLFLDLDGLKSVNDAHGHAVGDAALVHVTRLLEQALRPSDVIGRYGGDEFCVLLAHVDRAEAGATARRLEQAVADSAFAHDGRGVSLSVTIGVSMITKDDRAEALLERADRDMYARKG